MSQYTREDDIAIIQSMTLMDDIFMTVFFRNHPECVQDILDAVGINATAQSVDTQCVFPNVYGHSVTFDIKAVAEDNSVYDIEIQKRSDGANPKRARFYSSMLDIISLNHQEDYKELNDAYVIFITKTDVLRYNQPLYKINRVISGIDESFDDGSHIVYINTAYKGNDSSKISDLIHDFRCTEAKEIINENIRKRFNNIKAMPTEEEVEEMSELLEKRIKAAKKQGLEQGFEQGIEQGIAKGIEQGIEKGHKEKALEIAKGMLLSGKLTVELIAEFCNLTVNEVLALNNPT